MLALADRACHYALHATLHSLHIVLVRRILVTFDLLTGQNDDHSHNEDLYEVYWIPSSGTGRFDLSEYFYSCKTDIKINS